MLPTGANRQPALALYVIDGVTGTAHAMGLLAIEISMDRVRSIVRFEPSLMTSFGLPRTRCDRGHGTTIFLRFRHGIALVGPRGL